MTEVLCSGGVDTKLCIHSIKNFGEKRPKNLSPWPTISPIALANKARIVAMQRDDRIDLYQLAPRTIVKGSPVLVPEEEPSLEEFKSREIKISFVHGRH